ncbi:transposase [Shigella flexneri]|uniref:transposase n=1 Tax=Shigella flexneri TaxID=623 RepID=UPI00209667C9|nr:transposase [Shigella flexneri]
MKKRNFSAEFKRESAQLVVDQKYTVADAAKAMDVGLSTMTRWVKQLRDERQGKTPKASPITPEQAVPAVIVAIPDQTEYEPARKLLG